MRSWNTANGPSVGPCCEMGSWEQPVRLGEAMKQGKAKINQMQVWEEEKEVVEAAGGGEKSTNAELVFSATCSTVRVLYPPLTPQARPRQLLTYVREFQLFMDPQKRLVSLFLIHIPQSMSLFTLITLLCPKKSALFLK